MAALLWEGKLKGTNYADVEPPRTAALLALSPCEGIGQPDLARDRKTGEYIADPANPELVLQTAPMPPSHTITAVAPDGRAWQIVRAGIVWPIRARRRRMSDLKLLSRGELRPEETTWSSSRS